MKVAEYLGWDGKPFYTQSEVNGGAYIIHKEAKRFVEWYNELADRHYLDIQFHNGEEVRPSVREIYTYLRKQTAPNKVQILTEPDDEGVRELKAVVRFGGENFAIHTSIYKAFAKRPEIGCIVIT